MAIAAPPAGSGAGPPRDGAPRGASRHFARRRPHTILLAALAGLVVVALVVGGIVVSLSSSSPAHHPTATRHRSSSPPSPTPAQRQAAQLLAAVVVAPSQGATAVALDAPVEVVTGLGRITAVDVAPIGGTPLPGTLNAAGSEWTSSASALSAATSYRVTTSLTGSAGVSASSTSEFTTLTPLATVTAALWPDDGLTVGVGQPVRVTFDRAIPTAAARQALVSHLALSLSAPVPVGWYWFSDTELHVRPETYWPTGEQITFSDNLAGWDAGGGMWGAGSGQVHFGVGDARVSTANLTTDVMTVTDNGAVVSTYPISAGRTQYPTMNGVHIVMDRTSVLQMNSSTVGIPVNSPNGYNETVLWDVHISDSGEYVHAAPWSVADQGHENVSHGCINLSTANAEQFFNFSRIGDIVEVVGGPRAAVPGDHGVMDWSTPWSSFTPLTTS